MKMSGNSNKEKNWPCKKSFAYKRKLPTEISTVDNEPVCNYYNFKQYFLNADENEVKGIAKHVSICENFINRNLNSFHLNSIEQRKFFNLDYKLLLKEDEEILNCWNDLRDEIVVNTEYCLSCFGLAMHQIIMTDFIKRCGKINEEIELPQTIGVIKTRLINYEPILLLKDLKVNSYGKLASVRGTVIKAGNVKIHCKYMTFMCNVCKGLQIVKQADNNFTTPTKCLSRGCQSSSNFAALHSSPYTKTINWQSIKLQELVGNEEYDNGRVPRTLECELTEDLVHTCMPGDDITITGVIKVQKTSDNLNKVKQSSLFLLYLDAISVVNNKSDTQGSYGACERIIFNTKDYYAIQQIHAEPFLFRFLVQSLCPNIYGHEIVKAGLLLALFGGTKTSDNDRAESHLLMVGDPGLGKSQMLQACANIAPRGVYVCGNTSTSSGLTVTMTRESGGEYSLEAGALMLADQGCCCIDEFDKMPTQHSSLLEAMEQQSISIAKGGIVCTLPTRVTVLAAANPAGGHYNKAKTIAENLKISSPMLSRFDLIFILVDQPDQQVDMLLSKHILAQHSKVRNTSSTPTTMQSTQVGTTLEERLRLREDESLDHLPHVLFRKYIAYAQRYVHPQLSEGAKIVLKNFYLKLRRQFQDGNCTPVTTRQLKSLIRLTQARAKMELREESTEQDAKDVVQIMEYSLIDVFINEKGLVDTTRSQIGTGMSTRNVTMKLLQLLKQRSDLSNKTKFSVKEIQEVGDIVGLTKDKCFTIIENLNTHGFLLKKNSTEYQLLCADF